MFQTFLGTQSLKSYSYLYPMSLLVNDNEVETLHRKFCMDLYFPSLPMTAMHGFTKLLSSQGEIDDIFKELIDEYR